jgi:hypothetical protein
MISPGAGGCDFAAPIENIERTSLVWTAYALPSVIVVAILPPDLADPEFRLLPVPFAAALTPVSDGRAIVPSVQLFGDGGDQPSAILLPFDRLFEIRVAAAMRLWRSLTGRNPGPNPAALSPVRRDRLILALRGLDGRLAGATHREIAAALFGADRIPDRDWISHELRDQTARLVRLGFAMMRGGYRRLLLHPYRRRK